LLAVVALVVTARGVEVAVVVALGQAQALL
jgi:hypothetical protein